MQNHLYQRKSIGIPGPLFGAMRWKSGELIDWLAEQSGVTSQRKNKSAKPCTTLNIPDWLFWPLSCWISSTYGDVSLSKGVIKALTARVLDDQETADNVRHGLRMWAASKGHLPYDELGGYVDWLGDHAKTAITHATKMKDAKTVQIKWNNDRLTVRRTS